MDGFNSFRFQRNSESVCVLSKTMRWFSSPLTSAWSLTSDWNEVMRNNVTRNVMTSLPILDMTEKCPLVFNLKLRSQLSVMSLQGRCRSLYENRTFFHKPQRCKRHQEIEERSLSRILHSSKTLYNSSLPFLGELEGSKCLTPATGMIQIFTYPTTES